MKELKDVQHTYTPNFKSTNNCDYEVKLVYDLGKLYYVDITNLSADDYEFMWLNVASDTFSRSKTEVGKIRREIPEDLQAYARKMAQKYIKLNNFM